MSYGNNELPRQQRPAGCNPVFLIVIGIVALTLFNNLQPQGDNAQPNREQRPNWIEPSEPSMPSNSGNRSGNNSSSSDWTIEELDATSSDQPASNSKTEVDNGWSIEEVDTKSGTKKESSKSPQLKKTEKGDWSLEEVEKK